MEKIKKLTEIGIKMRLINSVNRECIIEELPKNLSELELIEGQFTKRGDNVAFFYEDNSGDAPIKIKITRFEDYCLSLDHVTSNGLIIICQTKKVVIDTFYWICKFCNTKNTTEAPAITETPQPPKNAVCEFCGLLGQIEQGTRQFK